MLDKYRPILRLEAETGLSRYLLLEAARAGHLTVIKICNRYLVPESSFQAFLKAAAKRAVAEAHPSLRKRKRRKEP